jgi:5-methylcytosine-specific restriction enzyme B
MIKQTRSWSKPNINKLIGRKKVDWSIFEIGTTIPKDFYEDFAIANDNSDLKVGEKVPLTLIVNDDSYQVTLINVKRDTSNNGSLQIRYDQNGSFKDLLKTVFSTSYQFLLENRPEKTKKPILTPNDKSEYINFYMTEEPYVYNIEFITANNQPKHSFWWVNQGQTFRQERDGGYLWAPQKSKQGRALDHHVRLTEPTKGDIVFCYSSMEIKSIGIVESSAVEANKPSEIASHGWEEEGYLLKLNYLDIDPKIKKEEVPREWRLKEGGPFNVNGDLKQGYFFNLSESFGMKLFKKFKDRFSMEVREHMSGYILGEEHSNDKSTNEMINHINTYIKSKGFYYEKEEVINLYLSLKTKPFVILSGISGTGKTMIVRWFAEAIGATEDNGQFTIIPVRPDWSDGSDLLGYTDIKGDFKEGPLTKVIKIANRNPEKPYIVLLDEMNLARVEYYFSDILSVMESRSFNEEGEIETSTILTEEVAGESIHLPANLYIVGTVNMDETTHPFSKKVLDRANTIEFNRVQLDYLAFLQEIETMEPINIKQEVLASKYIHLKDVYKDNPDIVHQVTEELEKVNKILEKLQAHVGYRVRDEICMYVAYSEEGQIMNFDQGMDHCLLQKILPRISGSDSRVKNALDELINLCAPFDINEDEEQIDLTYAKYPKSAEKLVEMRRRLVDGFTSFWIS